MKKHKYQVTVQWTGSQGEGTKSYRTYSRDHTIHSEGKYDQILGSSDPSFLGDKSRYNPEDLFLSSLSTCHMLWYLHLCTTHNITVTDYRDQATGIMEESAQGSGKFVSVTLHPKVVITSAAHIDTAESLHAEASKMCFIANSCNFEIGHQPEIIML